MGVDCGLEGNNRSACAEGVLDFFMDGQELAACAGRGVSAGWECGCDTFGRQCS